VHDKKVAAEQMLEIGETALSPVVHESVSIVAKSTGMQTSQIELVAPLAVVVLVSGALAAFCCAPAPAKNRARQRVERSVDRALEGFTEKRRKASSRQARYHDDDSYEVTARLNHDEPDVAEPEERPVV
jgi:hypothetical protein